jgi:hypothetical protein
MDVWVLRIVIRDRDPFEIRSEIFRHLSDEIACKPRQVNPVAGFRRQDDLPYPLVARSLPAFKVADDLNRGSFAVEPDCFGLVLRRALAGKIAPVCPPLGREFGCSNKSHAPRNVGIAGGR